MQNETLFPLPEIQPAPCEESGPVGGTPRIQYAMRDQVEMLMADLDSLIAPDHQVRIVWAFVKEQDLSPLYDDVVARDSKPGRAAIGPRILMALWLNATWMAWARRGNWTGAARRTSLTSGYAAGFR